MYLTRLISELLAQQDEESAYQWQLHFTPPADRREERRAINNCLRRELSQLPVDTCQARLCLTELADENDYIRHLKHYVIPTLLAHRELLWNPRMSSSLMTTPASVM